LKLKPVLVSCISVRKSLFLLLNFFVIAKVLFIYCPSKFGIKGTAVTDMVAKKLMPLSHR
ncbi:hypothetical protein DFH28DRAFT_907323, partial [Melampsora americana]